MEIQFDRDTATVAPWPVTGSLRAPKIDNATLFDALMLGEEHLIIHAARKKGHVRSVNWAVSGYDVAGLMEGDAVGENPIEIHVVGAHAPTMQEVEDALAAQPNLVEARRAHTALTGAAARELLGDIDGLSHYGAALIETDGHTYEVEYGRISRNRFSLETGGPLGTTISYSYKHSDTDESWALEAITVSGYENAVWLKYYPEHGERWVASCGLTGVGKPVATVWENKRYNQMAQIAHPYHAIADKDDPLMRARRKHVQPAHETDRSKNMSEETVPAWDSFLSVGMTAQVEEEFMQETRLPGADGERVNLIVSHEFDDTWTWSVMPQAGGEPLNGYEASPCESGEEAYAELEYFLMSRYGMQSGRDDQLDVASIIGSTMQAALGQIAQADKPSPTHSPAFTQSTQSQQKGR